MENNIELSTEQKQQIALDYLKELQAPSKTIDLQPGTTFVANNRLYTVSETFTIGRFDRVEELEEELLQASDKRTCHETMLRAMQKINEFNPGEAYTIMYNKIDSDNRNAKLTHYLLRMCTAYINYEGEDLRYLSEETIKAKIRDWSEEGLDVAPFILFAAAALREVLNRFHNPLVAILNETREIKEAIQQNSDIRASMAASGQGPSLQSSFPSSGMNVKNFG